MSSSPLKKRGPKKYYFNTSSFFSFLLTLLRGSPGVRKGIPNTFKKEDFLSLREEVTTLASKYILLKKRFKKDISKQDLLIVTLSKRVL